MENATEIIKLIHDQLDQLNSMAATAYVRATVTASLTLGPAGADLKGWITYNNEKYGKIYFESGRISEHSGLFAGGGVIPDSFEVLVPQQIASRGKFNGNGVLMGGSLMLYNDDDALVFKSVLPLAGAGLMAWSASGEIHFEKT